MAEEEVNLESLLSRAKEQEKEYDWRGANETYVKVLEHGLARGGTARGEVEEDRAYALLRHAFQAETPQVFRERLTAAASQYSVAKDSYSSASETESLAYTRRCDSQVAYIGYWLAGTVAERKSSAHESRRLAMEALDAFDKADDARNYGKAFTLLALSSGILYSYAEGLSDWAGVVESTAAYGERAVELLSGLAAPGDLAEAYAETAAFLVRCSYSCGWKDARRYDKKAAEYWKKAYELSEEVTLTRVSSCLSGDGILDPTGDQYGSEDSIQRVLKGLEHAKKTGDALVLYNILGNLACQWNWMQPLAQDPGELERNFDKALQYSLASQKEAARLAFIMPLVDCELWPMAPLPGIYGLRAYFGCEFQRVREFAEKAVEASQAMMDLACASGFPTVVIWAHHTYGHSLTTLARTERDIETKERLLRKSISHRKAALEANRRMQPRESWGEAVYLILLAEAESELASLADSADARGGSLREAAAHIKEGLDMSLKVMSEYGASSGWRSVMLGRWFSEYGAILEALHRIDGADESASSAVEAYEKAARQFIDCGHLSRAAEANWKAAGVHSSMGDFAGASKRYDSAAGLYGEAAKAMPQLKTLYEEHSTYMQAWAEIERARRHHARRDADKARGSYEKASGLLEATKRWRFLSENYRAWAEVENGEDLSREDKTAGAVAAFGRAAELFAAARGSMEDELARAEAADEKEAVSELVKASDLRREYCLGRVALEEARRLDKEGDELAACDKYGEAIESFLRIEVRLEDDQDRREIRLITTLAEAWQAMSRAEAETSPKIYREASCLFEKAKELSVGEKGKLLAAGNSRFCKAMEAGAKFSESGDPSLHAAATQDLESAAKHYLKAGLVNDSEYVKASKLIFDAYVYMDRASREEDQAKKARLYTMTEKVLEASAESYSRAGYPKKKDQAARLLEKVKEERELAATLTEILQAPDLVSSTVALVTAPSKERAAGLQKFERACLEATIVAEPEEVRVGDEIRMEIEVVNAGAGPAQLTRVENIVPPGFNVVSKPDRYRVEDRDIDLRGKKLDPLTTETVALVMKPLTKGSFSFTPSVLYLDESGEHKSTRSKHMVLTVKELGISGWLKGPQTR